jgi:hypothetical protein
MGEQSFAVIACWAREIHVVESAKVHFDGSVAVAGERGDGDAAQSCWWSGELGQMRARECVDKLRDWRSVLNPPESHHCILVSTKPVQKKL